MGLLTAEWRITSKSQYSHNNKHNLHPTDRIQCQIDLHYHHQALITENCSTDGSNMNQPWLWLMAESTLKSIDKYVSSSNLVKLGKLSLRFSTILYHKRTKHRIRSIKEGGEQEVLGICWATPTKWVIPGCSFVWEAYTMRALKRGRKRVKYSERWKERQTEGTDEKGGIGYVQKLSRNSLSVFKYPPNPGFIGCLCPAMLFGLSRIGREVGGLTHVLLCGNTLIRPKKEPDLVMAFLRSP